MHGQWSAEFCLQHCRVIYVVKQLLGPGVQARAWTELCEQAGVCMEYRPGAQATHNLKHIQHVLEGFSTFDCGCIWIRAKQ